MHAAGITGFVAVLLLLVLLAGCTEFSDEIQTPPSYTPLPPATVPATRLPVSTTSAAPAVITPVTTLPLPAAEPLRPLPPEQEINLLLIKDRPTSEIHLLYQGGPGDLFVQRILMRVYAPDNRTSTEYPMSKGRKPVPGAEIVAPGTRGGDRCEVFVISGGTRYKVIDQPVYAGMYY